MFLSFPWVMNFDRIKRICSEKKESTKESTILKVFWAQNKTKFKIIVRRTVKWAPFSFAFSKDSGQQLLWKFEFSTTGWIGIFETYFKIEKSSFVSYRFTLEVSDREKCHFLQGKILQIREKKLKRKLCTKILFKKLEDVKI